MCEELKQVLVDGIPDLGWFWNVGKYGNTMILNLNCNPSQSLNHHENKKHMCLVINNEEIH